MRSPPLKKVMNKLNEIKLEIEQATERRAELWHALSEGHEPELAAELEQLNERLEALWDEHRNARAMVRFGERDKIIQRARQEERLHRAA